MQSIFVRGEDLEPLDVANVGIINRGCNFSKYKGILIDKFSPTDSSNTMCSVILDEDFNGFLYACTGVSHPQNCPMDVIMGYAIVPFDTLVSSIALFKPSDVVIDPEDRVVYALVGDGLLKFEATCTCTTDDDTHYTITLISFSLIRNVGGLILESQMLGNDSENINEDGAQNFVCLNTLGLENPSADSSAATIAKWRIKSRFCLASSLVPLGAVKVDPEQTHKMETGDFIITICQILKLPIGIIFAALTYLQLYLRTSEESTRLGLVTKSREFFGNDEKSITAAACVLLAWKALEDTLGPQGACRKLFELVSALYKLSVFPFNNGTSVSRWIKNDNGAEVKRLKTQIIEHETKLLHAIDYRVGPLALPHTILPLYTRKFVLAASQDFVFLKTKCMQIENLAGLFLLECYKSKICLEYEPHELVVACIIKANSILQVKDGECLANLKHYNDIKNFLDKLPTCPNPRVLDQCLVDIDRIQIN
ncbi:Cyclin-like superfamily [Babesia duncani]|uniref:Cyclin-like superfamily n=1 Tax=Babesia duncani TaxID=323732 RepID=A0AAD9PLZ1_9APIC|nr:Cyclin-like superfamily [Babesia duncani]KAK2196828.1 Cyclin-like superfamily [Babesia duncani]